MKPAEQGAALLVMLLVLVVGAGTLLVSKLNRNLALRHNQQQDATALAEARAALIGYAMRHASQPGQLPCPDRDNDGEAEASCNSAARQVGRLPWKTLDLGDLRDGSGERLWYVVSDGHRPNGSAQLNSDTAGQLSLDGTGDLVALLIAPGAALSGQNRSNANNRSRYLDQANADLDGAYVSTWPVNDPPDFNDRVLGISRGELMRFVEMRVGAEARNALLAYQAANGYYPWAAALGDASFTCVNGLARGHLPLASDASCTTANLSADLPAWFAANGWPALVHYHVSGRCVPGTSGCSGSGNWITVTPDTTSAEAVVITAGPALTGQNRPATTESDLLDSAENADGDEVYEDLPVSATSNDQIRIVR